MGGLPDLLPQEKKVARKRQNLDHLTMEERQKRRKITNRASAQAARERKKRQVQYLEELLVKVQNENAELRESTNQLRASLQNERETNALLRAEAAQTSSICLGCGPTNRRGSSAAPAPGSDSETVACRVIRTESVKETVPFSDDITGLTDDLFELSDQPFILPANDVICKLEVQSPVPQLSTDAITFDNEIPCDTSIGESLSGNPPILDGLAESGDGGILLGACHPAPNNVVDGGCLQQTSGVTGFSPLTDTCFSTPPTQDSPVQSTSEPYADFPDGVLLDSSVFDSPVLDSSVFDSPQSVWSSENDLCDDSFWKTF